MEKIFIIEHLEPRVWKWCIREYKSISDIVGKKNLWFTNIKRGSKILEKYGKVFKKSVKEMNLKNMCVLDPAAKKTLSPKNSKEFEYFIFGGILGDYPPKKRTKKELTKFLPNAKEMNIGKKQFPTDNAVYVVKEISNGKNLSDLKFKNKIEIRKNNIESVILPFNYVLIDGKPLIRKEIVNYLKRKRGF